MPNTPETRLVADLGGTNLRIGFATRSQGDVHLSDVEEQPTDKVRDIAVTLADYWRAHGAPTLQGVAVCVAGPVQGKGLDAAVQMTNSDLHVAAKAIAKAFEMPTMSLINDFAALAAAVPFLRDADLHVHSGVAQPANVATVLIGPGTGLGVAAWLPGDVLVAGEGGHAQLSAPDTAAAAVWDVLRQTTDFISAEHVLSGGGLLRVYEAVACLQQRPAHAQSPAAIWEAWQANDPIARDAVRHFTAALGAYAGDLALIFGAGRVLLAGGILPRWGSDFDVATFRTAFEAKEPHYRERLSTVPSATITHEYPALLGLGGMPLG